MQHESPPPIEESLALIADIRDNAFAAAKQLGIEAVQNGFMTRKDVAEILGKHPLTISRWITASAAEVQAPSES